MSDEAAFLANLDDPATRAVYADWLEQRGDPRRELLRIADTLWSDPIDFVRIRSAIGRREELARRADPAWRCAIARPSAAEIRRRVGIVASLAPEDTFGADSHGWQLADPLDDEALARLEARLGAPLPAQYRWFLREVADGGAGPEYGLATIDDGEGIDEREECGGKGIEIAEVGCGNFYYLVLSGPDAGVVWLSGDSGFYPLRIDERWFDEAAMRETPRALRLEFVDWYVRWLEEQLWQVAIRAVDDDAVFTRPIEEVTHLNLNRAHIAVVPEGLRRYTEVRRISFDHAAITELPPWFGELRKLVRLDASYTHLTTLPDSIGELGELASFSLFRAEHLVALPASLGRLAKLRYLNLLYCKALTALPETFGALDLDELMITNCALSTLPASIGRMARVTKLDLRANRITALPETLCELPHLTELSLMENELRELPSVVGRLPHLESLTLHGNRNLDLAGACRVLATAPSLRTLAIGQLGLQQLPAEIAQLTQLRSLSLCYNQLENIDVLRQLPDLEELDLRSAQANHVDAQALSRMWESWHA